jgi:hypothetical protein
MTKRPSSYRIETCRLPEKESPFPAKTPSVPPPLPAPPAQTTDAALRRLRELERSNPLAARIYRTFRPAFSVVVAVQKTEEALRRGA